MTRHALKITLALAAILSVAAFALAPSQGGERGHRSADQPC